MANLHWAENVAAGDIYLEKRKFPLQLLFAATFSACGDSP